MVVIGGRLLMMACIDDHNRDLSLRIRSQFGNIQAKYIGVTVSRTSFVNVHHLCAKEFTSTFIRLGHYIISAGWLADGRTDGRALWSYACTRQENDKMYVFPTDGHFELT